jgi:hypothetical protein
MPAKARAVSLGVPRTPRVLLDGFAIELVALAPRQKALRSLSQRKVGRLA